MTHKIEISERAYIVLCGLLSQSEEIHHAGILAPDEVWDELRQAFPTADFKSLAKERGEDETEDVEYDPDFGF